MIDATTGETMVVETFPYEVERQCSDSAERTASEWTYSFSGVSLPDGELNPHRVTLWSSFAVSLEILKSDSPDPVAVSGMLTYTLVVTNDGTNLATGVVVTDTLPGSVTFGSAVPTQGTCNESGGTITCDLGNVAASASATITVVVTPTTVGEVFNTAYVTSNELDMEPTNDVATETTTVLRAADLEITKDDGQSSATPGEPVTYTIAASNGGPDDITGATVTEAFPAELTSCSWTCSPAGGATCTAGPIDGDIADTVDLPMGGTATYTVTCTIDASATGTLSNTAMVTAPLTVIDPAPLNNTATDTNDLLGPCGSVFDLVLDNMTVDTTTTFEGCHSVTAGMSFEIVPPGDVTFRAGQRITLANGFSVGSAAAFTAEIAPSLASGKTRNARGR